MGRGATGVAGMQVPDGRSVVALSVARGDATDQEVITLDVDGAAKRTSLTEYPAKGRGGKGLQTGAEQLRWCGVADDLHVAGDPPRTVRAVDLEPGRRAGSLAPIPDLAGPLTNAAPETGSPAT